MSLYKMIMIFLLPLILMSTSYYKVMTVLWRSTKDMTALTNTRTTEPAQEEPGQSLLSPYDQRPFTIRTCFRQYGGGGRTYCI